MRIVSNKLSVNRFRQPNHNPCECSDPGCPKHEGKSECKNYGKTILYRIDMEDESGTWFCKACAQDAMKCGLFVTKGDR